MSTVTAPASLSIADMIIQSWQLNDREQQAVRAQASRSADNVPHHELKSLLLRAMGDLSKRLDLEVEVAREKAAAAVNNGSAPVLVMILDSIAHPIPEEIDDVDERRCIPSVVAMGIMNHKRIAFEWRWNAKTRFSIGDDRFDRIDNLPDIPGVRAAARRFVGANQVILDYQATAARARVERLRRLALAC